MASIADENYLVYNQGKHPLVNFNFMLRVELLFDLPCKSVRAFNRELEYDFIQEGGLNDYVHMRRKPISKPFTLEVERYVGIDYFDCMPLGADLVLPVILFVSRYHSQFIPFLVARTYVFTGCTVMKKNYGELVGDKSGLLVETTTLGYREMLCVDIPWSMAVSEMFAGDTTNSKSAVSMAETLETIKQRSNGLYEGVKNVKNDAQAAYTDAEAKSKLIPSAITTETQNSTDIKARADKLEGQLPALKKTAEDAEKDAAAKQSVFADKRKAFEEAQKTYGAANLSDKQAQSALKDAQNAVTAAKWKSELLEKKAAEAADTLKDAQDEQSKADEEITTAQNDLDSAKSAADKAGKDAAQARSEADEASEKASQAATDADNAAAAAEGAEPGSSEAQEAEDARKAADEAQEDADKAEEAAADKEQLSDELKNDAAKLEKELSDLKKHKTDLEAKAATAKTDSETAAASAKEAKDSENKANTVLEESKTAAEKTESALTAAKSALDTAKTAFDSAKSEADTAKKDAGTKRAAYVKAEDDLKDEKRNYSKSLEILRALNVALKSTQPRLSEAKQLVDTVQPFIDQCKTENDAVQNAADLPEAQKHFPAVQNFSATAQKSLRTVKSTQSYFINCLSGK